MSQLSMGEVKWRMLRMGLKKRKFRITDVRQWTRSDAENLQWHLAHGFMEQVAVSSDLVKCPAITPEIAAGVYSVTEKGREAADLGFYDPKPRSLNVPQQVGKDRS